MEAKLRASELVTVEEVIQKLTSDYAIIREKLLSLPGSAALELEGLLKHEMQTKLRGMICEILRQLSEPAEQYGGVGQRDAAEADAGKPVPRKSASHGRESAWPERNGRRFQCRSGARLRRELLRSPAKVITKTGPARLSVPVPPQHCANYEHAPGDQHDNQS